MNSENKLTPLMQQYWDIKSQHPDKILLYRMGDFYEMFFDDAVKAAPILNIALTSRNKSAGNETPMCGVPHHSIGPQINKLLAAGLKVAICDQVEDPKLAKGIVRRAVTRVVTPGIVYDPETLDKTRSHYVAAVLKSGENNFSLAALDATTGEVVTCDDLSRGDLSSWILKLEPREILVENKEILPFETTGLVTPRPREANHSAYQYLVAYAQDTQGADVLLTLQAAKGLQTSCLKLSPTTIRHLELFKRMDGESEFSLFWAVDMTKTPMGARLLRARLASPFMKIDEILVSQDKTAFFVDNHHLRNDLRSKLSRTGDLERKIGRLSNPLCNARDLYALAVALQGVADALETGGLPPSFLINSKPARETHEAIISILRDDLPHATKEGGLIRPGINSVLDEYVDLSTHAQTKLGELEARERAATGIQSLKIKYNSVFGYSFEVTKANLDRVPSHFVRRQTLAGAERFVTAELSELEQKILSAQAKRCELEYQIFSDLRAKTLKSAGPLLALSSMIADMDLALSWAQLAAEQNHCRPEFHDGPIELVESRHAVLEKNIETFIPNDLQVKRGHVLLLTGPNMAGKSTLMRQVALIGILAQCGAYVPATRARLPVFDRIFTRIGASDNLSRGLSTFMVEMTETAEIVGSATSRSLVILDEIGRGTSTYDGMSLAQAVLEHFIAQIQSYTFFATHYHELTELAATFKEIDNAHMAIKEHRGELIFLRKVQPGPASRSYGIDVAKQAGLPGEVTARAQVILKGLVHQSRGLGKKQLDLFADKEPATALSQVVGELRNIKLDSLTPLEALNRLHDLQKYL